MVLTESARRVLAMLRDNGHALPLKTIVDEICAADACRQRTAYARVAAMTTVGLVSKQASMVRRGQPMAVLVRITARGREAVGGSVTPREPRANRYEAAVRPYAAALVQAGLGWRLMGHETNAGRRWETVADVLARQVTNSERSHFLNSSADQKRMILPFLGGTPEGDEYWATLDSWVLVKGVAEHRQVRVLLHVDASPMRLDAALRRLPNDVHFADRLDIECVLEPNAPAGLAEGVVRRWLRNRAPRRASRLAVRGFAHERVVGSVDRMVLEQRLLFFIPSPWAERALARGIDLRGLRDGDPTAE